MSKPLVNTTGQPSYELELRFTNYVKNCFVTAIRTAFANSYTPAEYRYSPNQAETQIGIYRAFPQKIAAKYPCILVSSGEASTSISTLNQEQSYEVYDNSGTLTDLVFSGVMSIPVRLSILAETTTDREKLTDLLSIYVRFVFRDLFYKYNMPYLDIQAGEEGENIIGDGSKVIYKGFVNVRLQTEFNQKISMELYEAITGIQFNTDYGTDPSNLQPNTES